MHESQCVTDIEHVKHGDVQGRQLLLTLMVFKKQLVTHWLVGA